MRILSTDAAHVVLVHLRLDAAKFEEYYCPTRMRVCVNLLNLHKLIKTLHVNDVLSMFIEPHDLNHLGISIENDDKKMRTKYSLNLMDLDEEYVEAPPVDFDGVTTLPSADFQKICRDMSNLSNYIDMRLYQKQLVLSCQGDWSSQETIVHDAGTGTDEILQGVFSLKHLVQFTKCTNLSSRVDLYLKNNYPLIIRYSVASLGEVSLCPAWTEGCPPRRMWASTAEEGLVLYVVPQKRTAPTCLEGTR